MVATTMMYSYTSFAGTRHTYNFNINRPIDAQAASTCTAKTTLIKNLLGVSSSQLHDVTLKATWIGSTGVESFYTIGRWRTKPSLPANGLCEKFANLRSVWNNLRFFIASEASFAGSGEPSSRPKRARIS